MAIRLPLQTVLDYTCTITDLGSGSVSGGIAKPFIVPQDTDNIIVKFTPSVVGATVSATLQTSDDGGTTWYDVLRTPTVATSENVPLWASAPVAGMGVRSAVLTPVIAGGSILQQGSILQITGGCAASTLAAGTVSGLPILGVNNRIFLIYTGNLTAASKNHTNVQVKVNSQSATA
jgi:hypothetical protein